jgi:hypothetical protein
MNENEQSVGDSEALDASASADMARAKRAHARMWLIQQFQLESAFIGVPKLAIILGVSPSTVWGYIREGKFFIPYRIFNKSPMVCIDDLVEWYCGPEIPIAGADATTAPATLPLSRPDRLKISRGSDVDDAVAHALASIGIDPKSKPGSLRRR